MKKNILLISLTILSVFSASTAIKAEEATQEQSPIESGDSSTSASENNNTIFSSNSSEPNGQNIENSIEKQTAVVNGEVVELEPPIKEGQAEANATEAPKEDLVQGNARSFRAAASSIPMYRLYNPNSGEHFYTKTVSERDHLKKVGWRDEGISWYSPNSGIPLYRLYNPNAKAGSHHYTPITSERDNLKKAGWRYEGIAWYAVGNGEQSHEDYRLLGVRNYNQYALGAPSGCEGASLLQALQYKGKLSGWSLRSFLNTIPKSSNGNPNNGFVGSPFVENAYTYSAIYPAPLTTWGQKYGNVQNISGSSMNTLINEVKNGNPVVAWVTINFQPIRWGNWSFGVAANNNHAVTLDGFNKAGNQVHVSDPISGSYWLSRTTFEAIYNARKFAVVVR